MKVAVTGATGFIGRHVVSCLCERGHRVAAMIRQGRDRAGIPDACEVVQIDLHAPRVNAYELLGAPDVVIHLAWGGLPNYESLHHFETELPIQFVFLKALVQSGLKHLVVAGTCFEYGLKSGPLHPLDITDPVNPYGYAKDALRRHLMFLRNRQPYDLTWARIFYLFGEGQAETSLFMQLRKAISRGDKVFPMSGGEQLRDYLDVATAAQRIVDLSQTPGGLRVANVCSGNPISVRRLVEKWCEQFGWKIELDLGRYPYPAHEPMAFWGIE
jgi:dTDP-6-deoxy-L-talose 4-dehydrogenase (NAD+)